MLNSEPRRVLTTMASQLSKSTAPQAADAGAGDSFAGDVLSLAKAREEAKLFERAARGDRAAIDEVWRVNRRWIAAVLAAHAPRGVDVEDLLQEVAATLVAKHGHIRDAASLRGWLRVVAINAARMAARSKSIERRSLRAVADGAAQSRVEREPVARNAAAAADTMALVARIPPIYAEPLLLQSTQGLTQRQLATLLDVPETTIETRLARARRMLRQLAAEAERAAERTKTNQDG